MLERVSTPVVLPHLDSLQRRQAPKPPAGEDTVAGDRVTPRPTGSVPVVIREDIQRLYRQVVNDLLPPEGPVADAFAALGHGGYTLSNAQVRHAIESFDAHKEALVVFEDKTDCVYSFRDTAEIETFTQLQASSPQVTASTQALHFDLQLLQSSGGRIVFPRGRDLLPTDAAGATVLLERGESVVLFDRYGASTTVQTADEAASASFTVPVTDAAKEAVVAPLQSLEKKGFTVEAAFTLPEDLQVTDFGGLVKHRLSQAFAKDPSRDPLQARQHVIATLAAGGTASVAPPRNEDPLTTLQEMAAAAGKGPANNAPVDPLALTSERTLTLPQLTALSQIVENRLTPEQRQAFDNLRTIREDATRSPRIFARETTGVERGALQQANDLGAYLSLLEDGGGLVLLNNDGSLVHLDTLDEVKTYAATGQVTRNRPAPVDPNAPKTNLLMLYYNAPFDPTQKGGIYEDTPLRASQVGSNAEVDMVVLRSDMPHKKNLRNEYLQPDDMQLLEALDPKTLLNDPKTLESFVYESLKAHPDDKHVRLMVAGHGGAELGLLPDGEANDASAHGAMSVDDFANAIHEGLSRFNQETGQSRKIDNLIVGSCLMGNTSFIHALAKKGDIEVLSASPETLMGNDPTVIFSYLADPKTADKSGPEFARDLVTLLEGASAFPGGGKNLQFADTFGAYDLSPTKGKAMADSLQSLFAAVVAEPKYARYVKEDIVACPTYGVNRFLNMRMGINQRDIIQVAERIAGDARIDSEAIKKACADVVAATEAVVIEQKMDARYADRRGPTLYLPTEPFAISERMMNTDLLKSSGFSSFIELVAAQDANRSLVDNLTYEAHKALQSLKKSAQAGGGATTQVRYSRKDVLALLEASTMTPAERAAAEVRGAEKVYRPLASRVYRTLVGAPVVMAATAVGALGGAALGLAIATPLGAVLGLRAGLTGRSAAQGWMVEGEAQSDAGSTPNAGGTNTGSAAGSTPNAGGTNTGSAAGSPANADPVAARPRFIGPALRVGAQAALFPLEAAGQTVNHRVSYGYGNLAGRLSGGATGAVSGLVGGAATGAVLGGALGGFVANRVSSFVTRM